MGRGVLKGIRHAKYRVLSRLSRAPLSVSRDIVI